MMAAMFRPATKEDPVWALFSEVVAAMQAGGLDQWDAYYPSRELLSQDVEQGQLFVLEEEGRLLGAAVLNQHYDPEYDTGDWQHPGPFGVIHRLCVNPACQGRGLGKILVAHCQEIFRSWGYASVRLDAFSLNKAAQALYESMGYERRGQVHFSHREPPFILYEKLLSPQS